MLVSFQCKVKVKLSDLFRVRITGKGFSRGVRGDQGGSDRVLGRLGLVTGAWRKLWVRGTPCYVVILQLLKR
jgi:hypothetical protein